jgi:aspartyl-tRNA(Asn)/glutamyl-tRNA(Gln) amidotransferase subunit B
VLGDLSRLANENDTPVYESPVTPAHVAELIALVTSNTINSKIAKELVGRMWKGEGSPKAIVEKEGLAQTSDTGAIDAFIDDVLAANEKSVTDYKGGKTNIMGFLVGQVMKASRGKANPALVQERLKEKLS